LPSVFFLHNINSMRAWVLFVPRNCNHAWCLKTFSQCLLNKKNCTWLPKHVTIPRE
jgi:hypothetical protein